MWETRDNIFPSHRQSSTLWTQLHAFISKVNQRDFSWVQIQLGMFSYVHSNHAVSLLGIFFFSQFYLFIGYTGSHCFVQAFSSFNPWASHCSGFSRWEASVVAACGLGNTVHRLSCSMACGIFPHQGSNPCPLHWQVHSYPLHHQRDPHCLEF